MPNWGDGARKRMGVLAGAVTLFASLAIAHAFAGPPTFELEVGAPPTSTFGPGIAPAVGPNGQVHVLDPANDRVQVFNSGGTFIREFGGPGNGDGDFDLPSGIAVGPDNHVYVGDTGLDRVQEFNDDGEFVRKWGSSGTGEGQFKHITAIAVNQDTGNVFVLDRGTTATDPDRITEFGPTGAVIDEFAWSGVGADDRTDEGEVKDATALAFDSVGGLWVADSGNHRIQAFNVNNEFVRMWGKNVNGGGIAETCTTGCLTGTASSDPEAFDSPRGITVDSGDTVYITDGDARIQTFSIGTEMFGAAFPGATGSALGQFDATAKIGPLAAGGSNLFVADGGNHRIQVFSAAAPPVALDEWGTETDAPEYTGFPAVNENGTLYVPDVANSKIVALNGNGEIVDEFGSNGTNDGEFVTPTGVAIANDGSIYVTDVGQSKVQRFDSNGTFLGKWGPAIPSPAPAGTTLSGPTGIAVNSSGDVFVADTNNNRVIRFEADGTYVSRFGSVGSAAGQMNTPQGLEVELDGDVLVADTANDRVQRFNPDTSAHLDSITGFSEPIDIALDRNRDLWVTDNTLNRAFNLAPDGTVLTQLGTGAASSAEDALNGPVGIAVYGDVFWLTLDFGSAPGRVRKYTDPGVTPVPPENLPPELPDAGDNAGGPRGGKGGGGGGFTIEDLDEDAEAGVLVRNKQRLNKLKASVICVLGPCNSKLSGRIELTKKIGKGKKDEEAEASAKKKKQRTKRQKVKLRRPKLSLESGQIKQVRLQPMGKAKKRKATVRKVQRKLKNGWKARAKVKLLSRTPSGVIASRAVISKIKPAK